MPCAFSPPGKPMRVNAPFDSDFDWNAFLGEDHLLEPPAPPPPQPAALDHNHCPSTTPEVTMLTTIMQDADRMYIGLPGDEMHHAPRNEAPEHRVQMGALLDLQNIMERFVELLQQLDSIYPVLLARAASRDTDFSALCKIHDCAHHVESWTSSPQQPNIFDYTLVQLLLSCHQRLLDVTETVLVHGLHCYKTLKHMTPENVQFDVPEVRIGTLQVPKQTAAAVWINLVEDSLCFLRKHLRRVPDVLAAVRHPAEDETQVVELQTKIATRRTDAMLQQLAQFRKVLAELNGLA